MMTIQYLFKPRTYAINKWMKNLSHFNSHNNNVRRLSDYQKFRNKLPKYMSFQLCSPNESVGRPLTLLLGWMNGEDKHLRKYRQLWLTRSFDVLTVRINSMDILCPPLGSKLVAKHLVRALSESVGPHYNEMVVHAFSGGSYQLGEALIEAEAQDHYFKIASSIKGYIFDSPGFPSGSATRFANALSNNPYINRLIRNLFRVYYKLFSGITLDSYKKANNEIIEPAINYPRLVFYSKDDNIIDFKKIEELIEKWSKMGGIVRYKRWDESSHVTHYVNHKEEYEQELDLFISCLNLKALGK